MHLLLLRLAPPLAALLLASACSHRVTWIGDPPPELRAEQNPLPMTVAVSVRSFEARGLSERGLSDRFAGELRAGHFFQGVMHPVPIGADPVWEIQLLVQDSLSGSDENFWKEFWANLFPPAAFFIWMETEYTLELEALLVKNREVVRSYASEGRIRNRYQARVDEQALMRDGLELVVRNTVRSTLHALEQDLGTIARLNGQ